MPGQRRRNRHNRNRHNRNRHNRNRREAMLLRELHIGLVVSAVLCSGATAWANGAGAEAPVVEPSPESPTASIPDPQAGLPAEAKDLRIDEQIGKSIPLDIPFVNDQGQSVTMADYLDGSLPVVLTFNYSSCPMLCNSQLNGLIDIMEKVVFSPGRQYRVVTIAIDHRETAARIAETKSKYVKEFREDMQDGVQRGWTFLAGDKDDIRAMADAVGFPFRYLEKDDEFAHPASLIFLSPTGVVTRYYHGIYYEPQLFSQSIFQAGAGEHGVSVGFLLACLTPSHQEGHARTGVAAMRYGALGFVLFLLAAFGTWQVMRTRSARQEQIG
jgi:protein SCO1/2